MVNISVYYCPLIFFFYPLTTHLRMEKIAAKSRSSQAKVVGSIISITGAFVLTLYKGHSIIKAHSHDLSIPLQHPFSFLKSGDADWVIAGILLTAECLIGSLCYIVQVGLGFSKIKVILQKLMGIIDSH